MQATVTTRTLPQIRTVIADDECLARKLLENLLAGYRDVTVIGRADCGHSALERIRREAPDLVFLDIMMPGMDGVELARVIRSMPQPPVVIFVTAFQEYAIKAFDLDVLDYLVKPIERRRLERAVQRAREAIGARSAPGPSTRNDEPFVIVRQRDELVRIAESDIFWLEAASQYVRIHTATAHYMVAEPLNRYHARLKGQQFRRVHRSAVVNVSKVARVLRKRNGVHELRLTNDVAVPVSRSRKDMVNELLALCTAGGSTDA